MLDLIFGITEATGLTLAPALLFTILLCAFMAALHLTNYGAKQTSQKMLMITVPEDLGITLTMDEESPEFAR